MEIKNVKKSAIWYYKYEIENPNSKSKMWKNQQSDIINMKSKIQIPNQSKMGYQKNPKLEIKIRKKIKSEIKIKKLKIW